MKALQYLWAFPNTFLGLLAVMLAKAGGGSVRIVDGVIEAHGGWLPQLFRVISFLSPLPLSIAAMTLGCPCSSIRALGYVFSACLFYC